MVKNTFGNLELVAFGQQRCRQLLVLRGWVQEPEVMEK